MYNAGQSGNKFKFVFDSNGDQTTQGAEALTVSPFSSPIAFVFELAGTGGLLFHGGQ